MSVFDGIAVIKRAFQDPLTDHKLPAPKNLSWAGITARTALSGTAGTHCDVVHGDRSYRFMGNHTEVIADGHELTVDRNQTIMIVGKHKETIIEDCCQSFIGPHLVTNQTARNETRMASCSTCYGSWWVNDNVGHTTTIDGQPYSGQGDLWYYADTYYQFARILSFELDAIKSEIHGAHLEVGVAHAAFKNIHREASIMHPQSYLNDDEAAVTWDKYHAIDLSVFCNNQGTQMFDENARLMRSTVKSLSTENAAIETDTAVALHTLPRIGSFIPPPLPV